MPGLHETKRQIKSIKGIGQITSAMELVAASKMRRAQERALGARPYASGLENLLARLIESGVTLSDPLLSVGKSGPPLYILVTADKGLCGGFNANILRLFAAEMKTSSESKVIAVGRKGNDFCRKNGLDPILSLHFPDDADYGLASKVAQEAVRLFLSGVTREVRVIYTRFISTVAHRPTLLTLLPIKIQRERSIDGEIIPVVPYILEPSPIHLMSSLLPKYISVQMHKSLLESKASELGARMMAMGSATDNTEQLIQELSLKYNRERQAAITREIAEIVGGANAL